jgi:acyl-CoA dehydrogenase
VTIKRIYYECFDGNYWVINGRKAFITGADGARVGIIMAKAEEGACMFLVGLPDAAIRIENVPNTIDRSMPGGHATVVIENFRVTVVTCKTTFFLIPGRYLGG